MSNAHKPRKFDIAEAIREAGNIKVGLFAPSGGGKTFSALRLAVGIQSIVGGEIGVLDTENRRATHYSDRFKFQHIDFKPPFGSLDYVDGIKALEAGCKTIIVDSMSHEHDGPGGMLDFHEDEVDRMAGDGATYQRREAVKMLAWREPKDRRRKLLRAFVESNANLILCFRAKESAKPISTTVDGRKKTEVVQMGFVPIAGDEFVFEMDIATLLLPGARGVATWSSDQRGESVMIKVPDQFEGVRTSYASKALDEALGANLAKWAQGGAAKRQEPPKEEPASDPAPEPEKPASGDLLDRAEATEDKPPSATVELAKAAESEEAPIDEESAGDHDGREPASPFAIYAAAVAEATLWPTIKQALLELTRTEAYRASDDGYKARARTIAYFRLDELNKKGVATGCTDVLTDAQAFLCWVQASTDPDAIVGMLRAFQEGEVFKALPTSAMEAVNATSLRRIGVLQSAASAGDFQ